MKATVRKHKEAVGGALNWVFGNTEVAE